MHLIQILLPLYDNQAQPFSKAVFDHIREQLAQEFGGVTAFVRSPAVGAWEDGSGTVCHDDVVLFEVVVDVLNHAWWRDYRLDLERQFRQDTILIRSTVIEVL